MLSTEESMNVCRPQEAIRWKLLKSRGKYQSAAGTKGELQIFNGVQNIIGSIWLGSHQFANNVKTLNHPKS